MLTTIHITVRDRVPTITAGEDVISHNSDYVAEFEFDEEWQDKVKTVYFVCEDGSYQAVVMSGNSCGVPMLDGEHRRIFVGVQAGAAEKPSILKTTRPCCLKVKDSIADYLGQPIPDPTPDVYEQIIAMLNNLTAPTWDSLQDKPFSTLGSGLSVDENGVLSAQGGGGGSANAVQYVAQTLTDEQKAQARENIGAGTSSFSGSYNDLTSKPTIPTQVTIDSTLKQSGQAADAKAVGDALGNVMQSFGKELQNMTEEFEKGINTKLDENQGAGNAGKILGIGEDGIVVPQDKPTYTLPQATADALGGIKADAATAEDTQVVRIGTDGKLRTKPSGGSVTVDDALSSTSTNPVQNKVVMAALAEKITAPTTATVGQIIKVKSVDTSGKPTEWEAVTAKLANPNALTFTGAVTGSYDGSAPVSVEIPSGGGYTWEETVLASGTLGADTTVDYDTGITLAMLREYKSFVYRLKGASNEGLANLYLMFGSPLQSIDRSDASGRIVVYEWADAAKTVLYMKSGYAANSSMVNIDKNFALATNQPQGYAVGAYATMRYIDVSALQETDRLKFFCLNVPKINYAFDIRGLTK